MPRFSNRSTGRTVLDVGTGTGRAAIALAVRGRAGDGRGCVGARCSPSPRRRARAASIDVDASPKETRTHSRFPIASFDAVVCLRVLMHTPDWRRSLAELCRVARERVVFDYPALSSAAAMQAVTRHVAHALGAPVEAYRVFSRRSIEAALRTNGFRLRDTHRQFVLPIAFHKRLNSGPATERIEGGLRSAGLTRLLGSPVTVVAERCAS